MKQKLKDKILQELDDTVDAISRSISELSELSVPLTSVARSNNERWVRRLLAAVEKKYTTCRYELTSITKSGSVGYRLMVSLPDNTFYERMIE